MVHMLMTLSGYILNDVVIPASVHDHDIKVINELLEGCKQSVVLGDLGYLSSELKKNLKQKKSYHLWTPFRQNMTEDQRTEQSESDAHETND